MRYTTKIILLLTFVIVVESGLLAVSITYEMQRQETPCVKTLTYRVR